MIFFGAFLGADELSLSAYPTNVDDITSVTLENADIDTLYVTKDVSFGITKEIPSEWNWDTIMDATYDSSTAATNIEWTLETVSHLIVKRKSVDEFDWTILFVKEINSLDDFSINETDITPTTGKYLYAVAPMLNGVEGAFLGVEVDVNVKKMTIMDNTGTWATLFTDGSCNTVNTTPGSFLTSMYDKYPTYVSNTVANYQTITVNGEWYPTENDCNFDLMLDDSVRTKYISEYIEFLTNRKPKILKNVDGRRWLVMVDDGVADNMSDFYKTREISFSCVEIGDPNSSEDLTINGILDIPEEYW